MGCLGEPRREPRRTVVNTISMRDATSVQGPIDLDTRYADWDRFEATLRATFGERVTREQATIEWEKLRHTTSIDDFVDEITRLM